MSDPQPPFANEVIRASAGTGKTYQLTNRFLALAAAGEPVDTILAATFTRKAAGEILDRVLVRLAEAAGEPEKLRRLAGEIGDGGFDRPRCLDLLWGILRRLHRLQASTLDSFFIQIARSFSLELGLPPGWQIAEKFDDERLRAEAIRTVLREHATGDVVSLMHLLTKGEASRSVSEQIGDLVRDLHDVYQEAPAGAWESLGRHKELPAEQLEAAIEALAAAELPADKRFANAREQTLELVRSEDWQEFLKKGFAAKIVEGNDRYYGKPIPPPVVAACTTLIGQAKAVLVGQIANQTLATRRLLEHFDRAYWQIKLSRRALRFADVTRRLGEAWVGQRLDEVVYRLDAQVAHLLLDEFQDTSPLQWRVLRPFARRAAGGGRHHSFFCVGDVKQAIYGWRGGEAEIFDALDEELHGLTSRSLNQSWRSSPVVIDTVDRVFENLAANKVLEKCSEAAGRWAARFQRHTTAKGQLPGHCRLIAAPQAKEGEDRDLATWRFAADEVARLHREAPGFTIGVLVRRNAAVARMIYELRHRQVEASEEGGNPLVDSPAVQVILSLLSLADHPGDLVARFHLARSPLGPKIGLVDYALDAAAWRVAESVRRQLVADGYGRTIYGWVRQLAGDCDARDLGRLVQLVEAAHAYEPRSSLRADDFVELVSTRQVENARTAQVRVMTAHKAKGLEFDVVVLAELDRRLIEQPPRVVVGRPGPAKDVDRVLRYVPKPLQPLLPESFQRLFQEYECRVVEEALCVLYVCLTRPVHALHMIVAPSPENESGPHTTAAGVLRVALTDGQRLEPGRVAYEAGDRRWHARVEPRRPPQPIEQTPSEPFAVRLARAPERPSRGLDRRGPSELEGGEGIDLARWLGPKTAAAFDRGSLMHAWLQLVEWLDGGPPQDALLREKAASMAIGDLDVEALLADFRRALDRPAIRALLSRATYQEKPFGHGPEAILHAGPELAHPRWEVWRERPFAVREADEILSGKIDRLVVLYDGDRPIAADVLDFKTDAIAEQDRQALDARVEFYRPQLEAYRRAATRLLSLDPSKILARLVFTEPGVIRAV
jgi:ATP-dependent exoDNAse (exonuclease V) beta subunit